MARPRTGITPLQHVRIPQNDWDTLRAVSGRQAATVLREFIRWYLRRPGAKLPQRPTREEVDAAERADE